MPEEALSMRKIREVLRLSALGLAQHQIARSCSIVQSTVHKYLKLAEAAQIGWPPSALVRINPSVLARSDPAV